LHLRLLISTKRPEPHGKVASIDRRPTRLDLRKQVMKKWQCVVCGLIYDEKDGWPDDGIAPGTLWQDVPEDCLRQSHGDLSTVKMMLIPTERPAFTPAAAEVLC
jgi:rubredoxin